MNPSRPTGRHGCSGHAKGTGRLCEAWAIRGIDKCPKHAGKRLAEAKAEGAVRAEVMAWGLDDVHVDPGETLLRLVAQSARRVAWLSAELERQTQERAEAGAPSFDGIPAGLRALIGHKYDLARDGTPVAVEEAIRGLAQLEAAERDRCARFAKLALDAGIAERQVRLAEEFGAGIAAVIRRVLAALDLSAEQQEAAAAVVPRELRAIGGAA